jgi:hypothetical protein
VSEGKQTPLSRRRAVLATLATAPLAALLEGCTERPASAAHASAGRASAAPALSAPSSDAVATADEPVEPALDPIAPPPFVPDDGIERCWPRVPAAGTFERSVFLREARPGSRPQLFDRGAAERRSPQWLARGVFADFVTSPARSALWKTLTPPGPHAFFEPWHAGICETAFGALDLKQAKRAVNGSRIGGETAKLVRGWPQCKNGHGAMALVLVVEAADLAGLLAKPKRLTIHACPACCRKDRHHWLDETGAASLEWRDPAEGKVESATPDALPEVHLQAVPILSFPPAWLFAPRLDLEGYAPIGGIASELMRVELVQERGERRTVLESASREYDEHFKVGADLQVGGFSLFRFEWCRGCKRPMRQLLFLNDYMTGDAYRSLFGGNELVLLSCDRTPACGGPDRGMLIFDP